MAMEIKVADSVEEKKEEQVYPCLKIHIDSYTDDRIVVLFTHHNSGVVLQADTKSFYLQPGKFCDTFQEIKFKEYYGEVTLTSKRP